MLLDRNSFAGWLMEADKKSGLDVHFDPQNYLEEADFYLSLKKSDWPCYVLQKIDKHAEFHGVECPPDPLHG